MTLSVVIPAYNAVETIDRCLDSVLSGMPEGVEVIVVDDGSTDETAKAAERQMIKVISLGSNRGSIEARKAGIEASTGDYVAFVDADDTVEPGIWSLLIDESDDADIVIYGYDEIFGGAPRKGYYETFASSDKTQRTRDAISLKTDPYLWTKMVRRSLLENISFPPSSMAEDWAMSVQFAMAADKVKVIDKPLYHYHIADTSFSRDKSSTEKIISRALSEKANVEFVEKLVGTGFRAEMDARKSNVKWLLFPTLNGNLKLWRETFPEINWRIFCNKYVGFDYKIKHLFALAGIFPIFRKIRG